MTGDELGALAPTPEFDTVRQILAGAKLRDSASERPGDDAVRLPSTSGMVASVDTSVEGTHFRLDWVTPAEAGARAVRAALSDLAAVGARPVAVLLALAGPDREVLGEAGRGARQAIEEQGAHLVGGDLARTEGPVTIMATVLGDLEGRTMLTRSGGIAGTPLWVTGVLGGAASAVHAWLEGRDPDAAARQAFIHPTPRWREALWLRKQVPMLALVDLSDGLSMDALNLGRASGVGVRILEAQVPVAATVRRSVADDATAVRLALSGGEDFELLLAADIPSDLAAEFSRRFDLPLTRVGELVAPAEAGPERRKRGGPDDATGTPAGTLVHPDGRERPLAGGFSHWGGP